jgi:uncharacterized protein (DUF362 family)
MNADVYVVATDPKYPAPPYADKAPLRRALQRLFEAWGLDADNPFGDWLAPGASVLIKPNWVRDFNPLGYDLDCLVSHTSIIKYLIGFLAKALDGRGTIFVGDAPVQNCDFSNLVEQTGMQRMIESAKQEYPDIEVVVEDWRLTVFHRHGWAASWKTRKIQDSLDNGEKELDRYRLVDLGRGSFLEEISDHSDLFRVTNYKHSILKDHHCPGKHEYLVTRRISEVDLVINLPKMKTHIKAGVTGALKNLVGINGHKEYLPHHIRGPYFKGGDNYCLPNSFREAYEGFYDDFWEKQGNGGPHPLKRKALSFRLRSLWRLSRLFGREGISAGSWSGNDTVWRMALDLNHIMYFSDWSPKRVISIVDGVIAGEGEGPLAPSPKKAGLLVGGVNPAYIDAVLAKLMGYNVARIPIVYHAVYNRKSKLAGPLLDDWHVQQTQVDGPTRAVPFSQLPNLSFKKPHYWRRAETRIPQ